MTNFLISLSRGQKKVILLIFDGIVLLVGLWLAISLRFGVVYIPQGNVWWMFLIAPIIGWSVFIKFGLYRAIIRYLSIKALYTIVVAVSLFVLIWSLGLLMLNLGVHTIPRSVPIIYWLICLILIGGSRFIARWTLTVYQLESFEKNTLIYGAGIAGRQLSVSFSHSLEFKQIAFIDDDEQLIGRQINGYHVYGSKSLETVVKKYHISNILIAIPSMSRKQRQAIIHKLEAYSVNIQTVPSIEKIANGMLEVSDIEPVDLYDLLDRDKVTPDPKLLSKNIENKVVMVTGAGGSIGAELCRQIVHLKVKTLILFELNEFVLYSIEQELLNSKVKIIPILGNVQDKMKVHFVCQKYAVQTIYHAAAYKHVPMVESNVYEGLHNNVLGTLNLAEVANDLKIETMVLISTDKAVRPTNVMGATKRFAELILQVYAQDSSTIFTMVRFGNVLGSSGSVVPLFRKQIQQGGPVTVTHPDINRFFMMIPEAVELVIQAGAMAQGGEVFILDMGESVRIFDMAKRMITLSGLSVQDLEYPEGDIMIEFTGLRPGEKLYEELLIGDDDLPTEHELILKANESSVTRQDLDDYLEEVRKVEYSEQSIKSLLKKVVPEYSPEK